MKLFCKCPLPKVGSRDWPWEETTTTGTVEVRVAAGADIPEDVRTDNDFWFKPPPSGCDGEPRKMWTAKEDLVRSKEVTLTTYKMPGYCVAEFVSCDTLDVVRNGKDGPIEVSSQHICATSSVEDGVYFRAAYAIQHCEQHARQQWVKQNLLTMQECKMGEEEPTGDKVIAVIQRVREEPKKYSKKKPRRQPTFPTLPTDDEKEEVEADA